MRNGSVVYFCARTSLPHDDIETFAKPVPIVLGIRNLTIQPASGYLDNQRFGEFVEQTNKGIAQPYDRWFGYFHEGDRFYLYKEPDGYADDQEPEDGWGYDADAQIVAVKPQNEAIALTIRNIVR